MSKLRELALACCAGVPFGSEAEARDLIAEPATGWWCDLEVQDAAALARLIVAVLDQERD